MIGVDANLLAPFLLKDEPAQYRRAVAVIASDRQARYAAVGIGAVKGRT